MPFPEDVTVVMKYRTLPLSHVERLHTVSSALYQSLLWGLVACLSHCISLARNLFLLSTNKLTLPFHSSLSNCITFKDTAITIMYYKYQHFSINIYLSNILKALICQLLI